VFHDWRIVFKSNKDEKFFPFSLHCKKEKKGTMEDTERWE